MLPNLSPGRITWEPTVKLGNPFPLPRRAVLFAAWFSFAFLLAACFGSRDNDHVDVVSENFAIIDNGVIRYNLRLHAYSLKDDGSKWNINGVYGDVFHIILEDGTEEDGDCDPVAEFAMEDAPEDVYSNCTLYFEEGGPHTLRIQGWREGFDGEPDRVMQVEITHEVFFPYTPIIRFGSTNPSVVAEGVPFVFSAYVEDDTLPYSAEGGTMTFTVQGGNDCIDAPMFLSSGFCTITLQGLGEHQIRVRYSGNDYFTNGSATTSVLVAEASPTPTSTPTSTLTPTPSLTPTSSPTPTQTTTATPTVVTDDSDFDGFPSNEDVCPDQWGPPASADTDRPGCPVNNGPGIDNDGEVTPQ